MTLVCSHASGMGEEGLGDYVLFIDCLIPLFAGVPFTLGVLPPASSVSMVPIFSGATPTSTCVVGGYLSITGTPPRASVVFRLESLSVFGTSPCMAGAEDPGGVTL